MAEQTTTTRQAAAWNPPRLRKLGLGADTSSLGERSPTEQWEGDCGSSPAYARTRYRMPTSGDTGRLGSGCPAPYTG